MKIFPFAALVGQEKLKTALTILAVNPSVGGVLIRGDKGSAKSTAARGLADIMPAIAITPGCHFNCDSKTPLDICEVCSHGAATSAMVAPPFVNLPLGAGEDRVIGSLDFERALKEGKKAFQPGLLASAHRGVLYIDEVNLLADHLVDILLDAAAMGENSIQREGLSISHPAKFALVGTMNLEEGDLRPQLLDRFGMMVEVTTPKESGERAEIVRRRLSFEENPERFAEQWLSGQRKVSKDIEAARKLLDDVILEDNLLNFISQLCCEFDARSLRADLVVAKVARTLSSLAGRLQVNFEDIRLAATLALPHRIKKKASDRSQFDQGRLDDLIGEQSSAQDQSMKTNEATEQEEMEQSSVSGEDEMQLSSARSTKARSAEASTEKSAKNAVFAPTLSSGKVMVEISGSESELADGRRLTTKSKRQGRFIDVQANAAPAKIAVNATLRHSVIRNSGVLDVDSCDLHEKVEVNKAHGLIVFIVDTSGSMAALKRMELVKGSVSALLDDAYERRDHVCVIAFGGEEAQLLLPPTRHVDIAQDKLKEMPTGGRTPLAQALSLAQEIVRKADAGKGEEILLVLLTDGKANVSLVADSDPWQDSLAVAHELAELVSAAIVIDTESGYIRLRRAQAIAEILQAECLSLDNVSSDILTLKIVSKLTGRKQVAARR